jgi:hypothetical protein
MVNACSIQTQSQRYKLFKVVNNNSYERGEPTSPILTDVHHDICGRTSWSRDLRMTLNRSTGKPVNVSTFTNTIITLYYIPLLTQSPRSILTAYYLLTILHFTHSTIDTKPTVDPDGSLLFYHYSLHQLHFYIYKTKQNKRWIKRLD